MDVRELTVRDIRDILESSDEGQELHVVEMLFPDELPVKALTLATGATDEALDKMTPGEISDLIGRVTEKNPFFVQMLGRLAELGRVALATQSEAP